MILISDRYFERRWYSPSVRPVQLEVSVSDTHHTSRIDWPYKRRDSRSRPFRCRRNALGHQMQLRQQYHCQGPVEEDFDRKASLTWTLLLGVLFLLLITEDQRASLLRHIKRVS